MRSEVVNMPWRRRKQGAKKLALVTMVCMLQACIYLVGPWIVVEISIADPN